MKNKKKLDSIEVELSPAMITTALRCSAKTQRQAMDVLIKKLKDIGTKNETN